MMPGAVLPIVLLRPPGPSTPSRGHDAKLPPPGGSCGGRHPQRRCLRRRRPGRRDPGGGHCNHGGDHRRHETGRNGGRFANRDSPGNIIRLAIGHYRGRMTEVARRLGIGRSTLYRKLSELGIDNAA